MAWKTPWQSHCDAAHCEASIMVWAHTEKEAIELTEAKGWMVTKDHDAYCPEHSGNKSPEKDDG